MGRKAGDIDEGFSAVEGLDIDADSSSSGIVCHCLFVPAMRLDVVVGVRDSAGHMGGRHSPKWLAVFWEIDISTSGVVTVLLQLEVKV